MALHTVLYYQWEYCPGNEGGGKGREGNTPDAMPPTTTGADSKGKWIYFIVSEIPPFFPILQQWYVRSGYPYYSSLEQVQVTW